MYYSHSYRVQKEDEYKFKIFPQYSQATFIPTLAVVIVIE